MLEKNKTLRLQPDKLQPMKSIDFINEKKKQHQNTENNKTET